MRQCAYQAHTAHPQIFICGRHFIGHVFRPRLFATPAKRRAQGRAGHCAPPHPAATATATASTIATAVSTAMPAPRRSARLRSVAETPSPDNGRAQATPASTARTSRAHTASSVSTPATDHEVSLGVPSAKHIDSLHVRSRVGSGPQLGSEPASDVAVVPPSDDVRSSLTPSPWKRSPAPPAQRPRRTRASDSQSGLAEEWDQPSLGEKTFTGDTTEEDEEVDLALDGTLIHGPDQDEKQSSGQSLSDTKGNRNIPIKGRAQDKGKARAPQTPIRDRSGLRASIARRADTSHGKRKYESESDSDDQPLAAASRRNQAHLVPDSVEEDVESEASFRESQSDNGESDDYQEQDHEDHPMAAAGAESDESPAPFIPDETRYETAKQREKRLRARKTKPKRSRYEVVKEHMLRHHPELANLWSKLSAADSREVQQAEQPPNMTIKLLPFQLEGIHWLTAQEKSIWGGGILADEMGMGKTIQMIGLFMSDFHERKGPVLVVAPTVAIMQWRNEINKYTPGMNVLMWHGAQRERNAKELKSFDVVLTSYQTMERSFSKQEKGWRRKGELLFEPSPLHQTYWHRIVLDEAHNIKERATNMAKAAFELEGDYRWCLSGTPLQNRVGELYSMIRFLGADPYAFYFCMRCECKSLHWAFSNRRSCDQCGHTPMHHTCFWNNEILKPIQRSGAEAGEGRDAFARLHTLLSHIMLRRTKLERADDMGLPPRTVLVRRDMFNEEEEDLYESLYKDTTRKFSTYLSQGTVLNNYSNIFTLLTRMRQMANHPDLVLRSQTGIQQHLLADDAAQNNRVCRICMDTAEDPILSKCRHVFCRLCIREFLETEPGSMQQAADCPYCHATIVIDLEQETLAPPLGHDVARQGILSRLDMDQWRSSTKIEALLEELISLRRDGSTIKSLVFSQFTNFLDLIAFRLQRAGFSICRLEGSMSPEARDKTIKHFQSDTNTTILLLSLKAGGVALNLVEASRVYLMDVSRQPLSLSPSLLLLSQKKKNCRSVLRRC